MSKKSKKAQIEDQVQDTSTTAVEETQTMEVAQSDVQESIPATIVEATEEQVFTAEPAVENGETEAAPAEQQNQAAEQATQSEQSVAKKPRQDKRPYIPWLSEQLEKPQDRKLLLKQILEQWPTVSKGGVQTFLTDMLNVRYSYYKDRPVIKLADGKVCFADVAPVAVAEEVQEAPAEEVAPTEVEANEQPVV